MVVDATGKEPEIGDKIAVAQGSRGAQPFTIHEVVKVTDKSVVYKHEYYPDHTNRRASGCFVIVGMINKGGADEETN